MRPAEHCSINQPVPVASEHDKYRNTTDRIVNLEDVCECGDFRVQHGFSGKCEVCGDTPQPWEGCKRFRFARLATTDEAERLSSAFRGEGRR